MKCTNALDGKKIISLPSGLRVPVHNLAAIFALGFATLFAAIFSLTAGSTAISLGDLAAFWQGAAFSPDQDYALFSVRLPRLIVGFMAGWCVALSGAMLQAIARNPLADPGLFGLSQGSVITIMILFIVSPGVATSILPFAAFAGGLAVAGVLLTLVGSSASGLAILLMGIAVESVLTALTSILILYTPQDMSQGLAEWVAGSLFAADDQAIASFMPWFLLSFAAILVTGRSLGAFTLGEDMAQALGEPVSFSRPAILLVAVLLSSAAVAAIGPLIFLGVMASHLAGFLSPATGRARLVLAALMGGLLVIVADALVREFAGHITLPIGTAIAILGVPLFIFCLRLRTLRRYQSH